MISKITKGIVVSVLTSSKHRPHKESEIGIGIYATFGKDITYGKFHIGIFFGKYLIALSPKFGLELINYFGTGVGG